MKLLSISTVNRGGSASKIQMPKEVQRQKKIMVQRAMLLNIFLREKPKCSRIFPEWELSAGSG